MLMKIYFYRYNNICEPAIIGTFKRLGLHGWEYLSITYTLSGKYHETHPSYLDKLRNPSSWIHHGLSIYGTTTL